MPKSFILTVSVACSNTGLNVTWPLLKAAESTELIALPTLLTAAPLLSGDDLSMQQALLASAGQSDSSTSVDTKAAILQAWSELVNAAASLPAHAVPEYGSAAKPGNDSGARCTPVCQQPNGVQRRSGYRPSEMSPNSDRSKRVAANNEQQPDAEAERGKAVEHPRMSSIQSQQQRAQTHPTITLTKLPSHGNRDGMSQAHRVPKQPLQPLNNDRQAVSMASACKLPALPHSKCRAHSSTAAALPTGTSSCLQAFKHTRAPQTSSAGQRHVAQHVGHADFQPLTSPQIESLLQQAGASTPVGLPACKWSVWPVQCSEEAEELLDIMQADEAALPRIGAL